MPALALDGGVIMTAIMALLLVMAVYFLVQLLIGLGRFVGMPNWPVIGGTLFSALVNVGSFVGSVQAWLWQHANPVNIVTATVGWLLHEMNAVTVNIIDDIYGTFVRLTINTIPAARAFAVATAYNLYNDAVAEINAARSFAVATAYNLYNDAVGIIDATEAVIGQRITNVELALEGLFASELAAAAAAAAGLVQSLQGWAIQELGALRTWVTGEIATTAAGIEGDIGTAVKGVENTLAPEIAAAAAVGAAAAATFKEWETKCGDPLCNNLSGFGNAISSLLGLVSDGALVALIAEAVSNPQSVVTFIENDIV